ncbi:hypothetical protein C8Q75DRAFT_759232 [Abortiporus biennis]|nr:hypothetical protein C8Q75DRAFT_759232 [Abortiporus biennis]
MAPPCWQYRPSRLIWFLIGAASATWYCKSKEAHSFDHYRTARCARHRIPNNAYQAPHARTASQSPNGDLPVDEKSSEKRDAGGCGWSRWHRVNAPPVPPPPIKRDEEQQKLDELGKKANETFEELSEATLDKLMSAIISLKAKLAENRAQREHQARQLQALKEEQARQYEEWRRQQPPTHL